MLTRTAAHPIERNKTIRYLKDLPTIWRDVTIGSSPTATPDSPRRVRSVDVFDTFRVGPAALTAGRPLAELPQHCRRHVRTQPFHSLVVDRDALSVCGRHW